MEEDGGDEHPAGVVGGDRPAYEIEGLLEALGSCVSAELDCMSKLSALHSELEEDHQFDKVDSIMEAIEL